MREGKCSIGKFEKNVENEDAATIKDKAIAVSDGAGGGGVYAEEWSTYLLEKLPVIPLCDFKAFDEWIDSIYEEYYEVHEAKAKEKGGMFLNKFYDEGSFATFAALWGSDEGVLEWCAYGDSVVFYYDFSLQRLQWSETALTDFHLPPYLISCNAPLEEEGFRHGAFKRQAQGVVFAATDALSQYILAAYMAIHRADYQAEIEAAQCESSKYADLLRRVLLKHPEESDFYKTVLRPLMNATANKKRFRRKMSKLHGKHQVLAHDDYSFVFRQLKYSKL